MWQRARRLLSSPARVLAFVMLGFFFATSVGLFIVGVAEGSSTKIQNGPIGAALFGWFIFTLARTLEALDAEDSLGRTGGTPVRPAWQRLRSYPLVVLRVSNTPGRRYILTIIAFILATSGIALSYSAIGLSPNVLFWSAVIGLFLFLLVIAVGAFALQDARDGHDR